MSIYSVTGKVIDKRTKQGIGGLSVEGWDTKERNEAALGRSATDENGKFILCIDLTANGLERAPDMYFKVYRGGTLLADTHETEVLKANDQREVIIDLAFSSEDNGRDRVTAMQAFKAATFFEQSDFGGFFRDVKQKAGTRAGLLADLVVNALSNLDEKPVRASAGQEKAVVNQDVETARQALAAQQVEVNEVLAYDPKLSSASLKNIANFPVRMKAGQRVNLYVENDKVKYYSVVQSRSAEGGGIAGDETHKRELEKMNSELNATKADLAKKDEHIKKLEGELKAMRESQEDMVKLMKSPSFKKLMKEIDDRDRPNG